MTPVSPLVQSFLLSISSFPLSNSSFSVFSPLCRSFSSLAAHAGLPAWLSANEESENHQKFLAATTQFALLSWRALENSDNFSSPRPWAEEENSTATNIFNSFGKFFLPLADQVGMSFSSLMTRLSSNERPVSFWVFIDFLLCRAAFSLLGAFADDFPTARAALGISIAAIDRFAQEHEKTRCESTKDRLFLLRSFFPDFCFSADLRGPKSFKGRWRAAEENFKQGKFKFALDIIMGREIENPKPEDLTVEFLSPALLLLAGNCLARLRQFQSAAQFYRAGISLCPTSCDERLVKGNSGDYYRKFFNCLLWNLASLHAAHRRFDLGLQLLALIKIPESGESSEFPSIEQLNDRRISFMWPLRQFEEGKILYEKLLEGPPSAQWQGNFQILEEEYFFLLCHSQSFDFIPLGFSRGLFTKFPWKVRFLLAVSEFARRAGGGASKAREILKVAEMLGNKKIMVNQEENQAKRQRIEKIKEFPLDLLAPGWKSPNNVKIRLEEGITDQEGNIEGNKDYSSSSDDSELFEFSVLVQLNLSILSYHSGDFPQAAKRLEDLLENLPVERENSHFLPEPLNYREYSTFVRCLCLIAMKNFTEAAACWFKQRKFPLQGENEEIQRKFKEIQQNIEESRRKLKQKWGKQQAATTTSAVFSLSSSSSLFLDLNYLFLDGFAHFHWLRRLENPKFVAALEQFNKIWGIQ